MPAPTPSLASRAAVVATGTTAAALLALLPAAPPVPVPAAAVSAWAAVGDAVGGDPTIADGPAGAVGTAGSTQAPGSRATLLSARPGSGAPLAPAAPFALGSRAVPPHPATQTVVAMRPFQAAIRALGGKSTPPAASGGSPAANAPLVMMMGPASTQAAGAQTAGAAGAHSAPAAAAAGPGAGGPAPAVPRAAAPAAAPANSAAAPAKPAAAPAKPAPAANKPAPAAKPAPAGGGRGRAMANAMSKLGAAYRWGATGPNAFDCSGLVYWSYRQVGLTLPRTSQAQSQVGTPIAKSALQPGDLVFFYRPVSHVAIYVGNGQVVHASTAGSPVKISQLSTMPFATARRI